MTNIGLIRKFVRGATEGTNSSRNLGIFGDDLVHYETVIARRQWGINGDYTMLLSSAHYSATTNRVISHLCQEYTGMKQRVPHEELNNSEFTKLDWGAKLNYTDPYEGIDPIFRL